MIHFLKNMFHWGCDDVGESLRRCLVVTNVMAFFVAIVCVTFAMLYGVLGLWLNSVSALTPAIAGAGALALNYYKKVNASRITLFIPINIALLFAVYTVGPGLGVSNSYFTMTLVPFMLFDHRELKVVGPLALVPLACKIFLEVNPSGLMSGIQPVPSDYFLAFRLGTTFTVLISAIICCITLFYRLNQYSIELELQREHELDTARMTMLGETSASIAHEIRNPLAVIEGKAHILKARTIKGKASPEMTITIADQISSQVERITGIIRSIQSIAHSSRNENIQPCKVAQIIRDTQELTKERAMRAKTALIWPKKAKLKIECFPGEITQVLVNIINNAIGAVKELDERWVWVELETVQEVLLIKITDSGQGISPEIADKIMNPFYTTKPTGEGTGLGLSISCRLMEKHQGSLRYNPDCPNTQFIVALPIQQQERPRLAG